jgi:hypothetical protein
MAKKNIHSKIQKAPQKCEAFKYQKRELPKGSQDRTCLPQRKARTAYWPQDFYNSYKNKKPRISTRFLYQERESNPHDLMVTRF